MAVRPRVVLLHSSDEMYGADRMLLHVADAIRTGTPAGVEVWLPTDVAPAASALSAELTARGIVWRRTDVPVLRRAYLNPRGALRLARSGTRLWRALRVERPAVVWLGNSALLPAAPIAVLARVRHRVLHVQERWEGREAGVLRVLARFARTRIAIAPWVAAATGLDPVPLVIENCVDDAAERSAGSTVPDGPLTFVVASRWNRWKGHMTLLRAWDLAGCPGRLVVLGGPPPVGDAVDVPAVVGELVSRPDTVEIVGEVPDIAPYVAAADVVVLPSDEPEPFGLVVIEAFALSRPVVASDAGGPAGIITDGVDGWRYAIGDAEALADVLRSLTRERARAAGVEARATYQRRYVPERYHAQIAALVEPLL
jgi:glycosyltransferase involved in cell wall biosynthesis